MRLRGIAVLALSTTACAAVIGLGDYEVAPEDAVASLEAGADSGVVKEAGNGLDAPFDAPTNTDAETEHDAGARDADASVADAKADADAAPVDAGKDASTTRDGVACASSTEVCAGTCCHRKVGTFECIATATCEGAANGDPFECDDDSDCVKKGLPLCCVNLGADGHLKDSFCNTACSDAHACITTGDCGGSNTCLPPKTTYATALPLLKVCR